MDSLSFQMMIIENTFNLENEIGNGKANIERTNYKFGILVKIIYVVDEC